MISLASTKMIDSAMFAELQLWDAIRVPPFEVGNLVEIKALNYSEHTALQAIFAIEALLLDPSKPKILAQKCSSVKKLLEEDEKLRDAVVAASQSGRAKMARRVAVMIELLSDSDSVSSIRSLLNRRNGLEQFAAIVHAE